jgi:FAD/FMN-containing dehydrogenase
MPGHSLDAVAARLRRELTGEVLFDAGSRGRYSTDASIYQIEPLGVVVPRTTDEAIQAGEIAVSCRAAPAPRSAARPSVPRWSST